MDLHSLVYTSPQECGLREGAICIMRDILDKAEVLSRHKAFNF